MEELLASIRKAIQDDIGEGSSTVPAPASRASAPSVSASMRESRVRPAGEAITASDEINGLRDRIQRNRPTEPAVRERTESAPPAARPGLFSAALAPEPQAPSWQRAAAAVTPPRHEPPARANPLPPAPPLRPSFAETEPPPVASYAAPENYRAPGGYGRFGREVEALQQQAQPSWREPQAALPPPEPMRGGHEGAILSEEAAATASSAFGRLADSFLARALGDRPIEDMARDILRGLLKQWLDENLPALVERLVREEIERVARRGR
jgi:cell pole-organizing protein PopZ